jgi:DNA-binding FadR family transcriptional regulator
LQQDHRFLLEAFIAKDGEAAARAMKHHAVFYDAVRSSAKAADDGEPLAG